MRLRPYRPGDLSGFVALLGDPAAMRYVGEGVPYSEADATALFARGLEIAANDPAFHIWAVEIDGAYAGHAELKRRRGKQDYELIYYLAKPYWGRGYGRRLAAELVAFGFETRGLSHVIATVHEEHAVSRRILESLGFREDERIGREYDPLGYLLDADTYRSSRTASGN